MEQLQTCVETRLVVYTNVLGPWKGDGGERAEAFRSETGTGVATQWGFNANSFGRQAHLTKLLNTIEITHRRPLGSCLLAVVAYAGTSVDGAMGVPVTSILVEIPVGVVLFGVNVMHANASSRRSPGSIAVFVNAFTFVSTIVLVKIETGGGRRDIDLDRRGMGAQTSTMIRLGSVCGSPNSRPAKGESMIVRMLVTAVGVRIGKAAACRGKELAGQYG